MYASMNFSSPSFLWIADAAREARGPAKGVLFFI
jgi:hypothetical protein